MKWILLALLTVIALVVDWFAIHSGFHPVWYFWGGWTLVWICCYLILRKFWQSILAVIIIACVEDFLYLTWASIQGERSFYPLYCHEWVTDIFGRWSKFLALDWLGVPSSYYIIGGIILILIMRLLWQKRHRNN